MPALNNKSPASDMSVKRVLLVASAACAVGLVVWKLLSGAPTNPMRMAELYRDSLISGDTSTLLSLISEAELEDNRMTQDQAARFFREWVRPKLLKVNSEGSLQTYGTGASGFQSYMWGVVTTKGRLPLTVDVALTDSGMKVVHPMSTVIITLASVKPDGSLPRGALEKLTSWAENVHLMEPELARYGMTKIRVRPEWDAMTFPQFVKWCEDRKAMARRP